MKTTDPTYIRTIYDSLRSGDMHKDNSSALSLGLVGLYEEALPPDCNVNDRKKLDGIIEEGCRRFLSIKPSDDKFNLACKFKDQLFSKIRSGDVFAEKGNLKKAIEIYTLSRSIFIDNYGLNFPHIGLRYDKINDV